MTTLKELIKGVAYNNKRKLREVKRQHLKLKFQTMLERIKESITKKSYCSKCDELVGYYVVLETRKIKFGEIAFEATLKMAYCKHCRNKVSVHKIKKYNDKVINDTYKKICNNGKKLTKTEKIILKGIKIVYEN